MFPGHLRAEAASSVKSLRSLLSVLYILNVLSSTLNRSSFIRNCNRRSTLPTRSNRFLYQEYLPSFSMKLSTCVIAAFFAASSMALPGRVEIGISPANTFGSLSDQQFQISTRAEIFTLGVWLVEVLHPARFPTLWSHG